MMTKMILFLSLSLVISVVGFSWHSDYHQRKEESAGRSVIHTVPLGSEATFHWRVDLVRRLVAAEVHYAGNESCWFAIGFSDYGELMPADYCILWVDWHRQTQLQDAWTDEGGNINLDKQQDCNGFAWRKRGNLTKFTFSRKFDTCDEHDYVMEVKKNTVKPNYE